MSRGRYRERRGSRGVFGLELFSIKFAAVGLDFGEEFLEERVVLVDPRQSQPRVRLPGEIDLERHHLRMDQSPFQGLP